MRKNIFSLRLSVVASLLTLGIVVWGVQAQEPVRAAESHAQFLNSGSTQAKAQKRLVYDFWRTVLEAGQLGRTSEFLSRDYIQHNPNVPTGRNGFVEFFKAHAKPTEIKSSISMPLVAMTSEGDLVTLAFAKTYPRPDGEGTYTSTWFDMFRVHDGKIVEHWDSALLHEQK